ncbi:MAG: hypothetical protein K6F84_03335, partial [Lachnospiraceae bacterium]|nr:hypothetical protein [Lachnospiraceae bacterium]
QDDAKFATRIVRNILTEVLPYLNIPMTEPLCESEIEELNALQIDIKNSYINENQEAETASDEENPEGTKPQDETSDTVAQEGDAQSTEQIGETTEPGNNLADVIGDQVADPDNAEAIPHDPDEDSYDLIGNDIPGAPGE